MSQKEKLISKLKYSTKSFTFDDAEALLGHYGYHRYDKGKTSGSRVIFVRDTSSSKIMLHKPHPQKELREYQVKQLIRQLTQEGLL